MVLNPNGIEPTFLKLDSWSPGAGFIPIITSNLLNYIKKIEFKKEKKSVLCLQKTFNAVFKNGFNHVLGSIPRLPLNTFHNIPVPTKLMYCASSFLPNPHSKLGPEKQKIATSVFRSFLFLYIVNKT